MNSIQTFLEKNYNYAISENEIMLLQSMAMVPLKPHRKYFLKLIFIDINTIMNLIKSLLNVK